MQIGIDEEQRIGAGARVLTASPVFDQPAKNGTLLDESPQELGPAPNSSTAVIAVLEG